MLWLGGRAFDSSTGVAGERSLRCPCGASQAACKELFCPCVRGLGRRPPRGRRARSLPPECTVRLLESAASGC